MADQYMDIKPPKDATYNKIPASYKLWKLIKQPDGYYYEIRLKGIIIDRIKVEYPALATLKKEGLA